MQFPTRPSDLGAIMIVEAVLKEEGGYVNHANDRGGETNYGITIATARQNGYSGPMKDMPRAFAFDVYMTRFWTKPGFEDIAKLGLPRLAYVLADWGVNSGPTAAIRALQRVLNALNLNGKRWADIGTDGAYGKMSSSAVSACKATFPDAEEILIELCSSIRGERFISLCENDGRQESFMLGWARRLNRVEDATEENPHA